MSETKQVPLAITHKACTVVFMGKLGSDHTVVEAARLSYNTTPAPENETMNERDIRLVRYLAKNGHMSPFRHISLQFWFEVPEAIARQLYKHVVGINTTVLANAADFSASSEAHGYVEKDHAWNEISGRYCVMTCAYQPPVFHSQHSSSKQCSAGPLGPTQQTECAQVYTKCVTDIWKAYETLLSHGVAKEEARFLLPMCFMTKIQWTVSLQALVHFIKLRNHPHAQTEIQELARMFEEHLRRECPIVSSALLDDASVVV